MGAALRREGEQWVTRSGVRDREQGRATNAIARGGRVPSESDERGRLPAPGALPTGRARPRAPARCLRPRAQGATGRPPAGCTGCGRRRGWGGRGGPPTRRRRREPCAPSVARGRSEGVRGRVSPPWGGAALTWLAQRRTSARAASASGAGTLTGRPSGTVASQAEATAESVPCTVSLSGPGSWMRARTRVRATSMVEATRRGSRVMRRARALYAASRREAVSSPPLSSAAAGPVLPSSA